MKPKVNAMEHTIVILLGVLIIGLMTTVRTRAQTGLTLDVDGVQRTYTLYVPASYDAAQARRW